MTKPKEEPYINSVNLRSMKNETLERLKARIELVLKERGVIPPFEMRLRGRIATLMLAEDQSCISKIIEELEKILEW